MPLSGGGWISPIDMEIKCEVIGRYGTGQLLLTGKKCVKGGLELIIWSMNIQLMVQRILSLFA